MDDCEDHGCDNGATCIDGVGNYTCLCPPNYTGTPMLPSAKRLSVLKTVRRELILFLKIQYASFYIIPISKTLILRSVL